MQPSSVLLQVVLLGQLSKDLEKHFGAFEITAGGCRSSFYPPCEIMGCSGSPTWLLHGIHGKRGLPGFAVGSELDGVLHRRHEGDSVACRELWGLDLVQKSRCCERVGCLLTGHS